MALKQPQVSLSTPVSDEVKNTTCYMCACRCGIRVHLRDGKLRYIEGNPNHPVNRGVLCAKGSAGIMHQHSPAKLNRPLKRVGPRGSGEFVEIEWEEAMTIASRWLGNIRNSDPKKLAFFTGRDQSQALTGYWASQFGTPNYAAHGGFCSVNMAAAGLYTIGSSFWEFGEPDWEHTRYLLMFGVAEDHDSNPLKIGIGKLKGRNNARFVSVNPVRTGYSSVADEWLGIRPGTDGLFVMALIHQLLHSQQVDLEFLVRYTNAHWLVRNNPGQPDDGLFVRREGKPLAWDRKTEQAVDADQINCDPQLFGDITLEGNNHARPVFQLMAERYMDEQYSPQAVAERCGIDASTIERIASELAHAAFEQEIVLDIPWTDWAGRHHKQMIGRPVSMHAMRGISAHSNGFHTCRAIHLLQMLLGSIDCPGGFRSKAPFPKPCPPGLKPTGKSEDVAANTTLGGAPLGFVQSPEDLLVDDNDQPCRIDGAYSWQYPLAAHGLMHLLIRNAWQGKPYPIDTLFMYMANMGWNSSMNTDETVKMLTDKDPATGKYRIAHIIYSDAFASETVSYADLILPDTTYLERFDCISLLDRPISTPEGPADAIRQPVLTPDRDVRPFQDVLIDLAARLGLPGFVGESGEALYPGGYPDYMVNHERSPGIGSLGGWRGEHGDQHGRGKPHKDQLKRYIENDCHWEFKLPKSQQYYKHANKDYLEYATKMGWIPKAEQIVFQLYSEPMQKFRLAGYGHGSKPAPSDMADRIKTFFDPLPIWYAPLEEQQISKTKFPLHAITQRPMAMYHSWGSHNAWLRQIHGWNRLFIHVDLAAEHDLKNDDWVDVESHNGKIRAQVQCMTGCNRSTVWTWNAIGKRKGAWNLSDDAEESQKGMLLNNLISDLLPDDKIGNADPVTGQAAWFDLRVSITKARGPKPSQKATPEPVPGLSARQKVLRYGAQFLPPSDWRRKDQQ